MKPRIIVAAGVGILVLGAVAYTLTIGRAGAGATAAPDQPVASSTTESDPPGTDAEGTDAPAADSATAGAYVDYSPEALAAAEGSRVLFFHAPWCPNCRDLEEDISAVGIPAGVTVVKVDFDTELGLREKYGVTQQTTVVLLDADGAEVDQANLSADPSVASLIDELGLPAA
jgi:thiol-disulfide isomerase/thioredoxin